MDNVQLEDIVVAILTAGIISACKDGYAAERAPALYKQTRDAMRKDGALKHATAQTSYKPRSAI